MCEKNYLLKIMENITGGILENRSFGKQSMLSYSQ